MTLRRPESAVLVDTSEMTEDEVLVALERRVRDALEPDRAPERKGVAP